MTKENLGDFGEIFIKGDKRVWGTYTQQTDGTYLVLARGRLRAEKLTYEQFIDFLEETSKTAKNWYSK